MKTSYPSYRLLAAMVMLDAFFGIVTECIAYFDPAGFMQAAERHIHHGWCYMLCDAIWLALGTYAICKGAEK